MLITMIIDFRLVEWFDHVIKLHQKEGLHDGL